ncbi:MAG: bis(5'-nucleosyl)-tetraphosphatase (symmetrical) YqeK [Coriobacteriia bacterium]|nr:bis(5'-nucleosyl)-tetraphosphatase (symmetrical) YqeK [Coriobacteriia bacterium]
MSPADETAGNLDGLALDYAALYQDGLAAIQQRLIPSRVEHSVSVAKTAAHLAALYGVDADQARIAGLLHDWDKDLPTSELLAIAARHGIAVPQSPEKTLHAQTGAYSVGERFGQLPPAVLQAIARHTLAAAGMFGLDMVIYIADLIEPLRDKGDFSQLRAAVGQVSLPDLFMQCLRASLEYLLSRQRHIEPESLSAWNSIIMVLSDQALEDK